METLEMRDIAAEHDAFEENTILLPDVGDGKHVEYVMVEEAMAEMHGDEPAIDIKGLQDDCQQEDALAEPLADAEKLMERELNDLKPLKDFLVKEEAKFPEELVVVAPRKPGRRGRKPASERIEKPKSPLPEPVRTRNRNLNKSLNKEIEPVKKSEVKKEEKPRKVKTEKIVDEEEKETEEADISIKDEEQSIDDDQCRICLSKDNLTSIFLFDNVATIADKIMTICSSIKILEKDYLPQFICNACLQSVNVAFNLKILCETTDKQLRSKLKRSKKKVRRPTEFVLIDCKDLTEESEEEGKFKDDDEFHISNESGNSEPDSDSDSSFGVNKNKKRKRRTIRRRRSAGVRRRGRLPGSTNAKRAQQIEEIVEEANAPEIESIVKAAESTEEDCSPPKKRRSRKAKTDDGGETTTPENSRRKEHPCVYCNQVFPTANTLREHKKSHAGEKPFTCHICSKPFKLLGSFNSHLKRHKEEDDLMCHECEKHFPNKTEFRRHKVDVHGEAAAPFVCDKCKRAFTTKPRLDRHQESKCPGFEVTTSTKKAKPEMDAITLGRDLFKCVAPMTTTYWSDSFSD